MQIDIYDVKCTFEPKLRLQSKDCHVVTRSFTDTNKVIDIQRNSTVLFYRCSCEHGEMLNILMKEEFLDFNC